MQNTAKNLAEEYTEITKQILNGKTIPEIAQSFNYSQSTISNRLNSLFQLYNASNRYEFINNFFYKIIDKYKVKLQFTLKRNRFLKKHVLELENKIFKTEKYSDCRKELIEWIEKCKEYLE